MNSEDLKSEMFEQTVNKSKDIVIGEILNLLATAHLEGFNKLGEFGEGSFPGSENFSKEDRILICTGMVIGLSVISHGITPQIVGMVSNEECKKIAKSLVEKLQKDTNQFIVALDPFKENKASNN